MEDVNYIKMRTTARVNYRTSCHTLDKYLAGVLEANTMVNAVSDFYDFSHGHFWRKVKINRKHFYIMADFLKESV